MAGSTAGRTSKLHLHAVAAEEAEEAMASYARLALPPKLIKLQGK